MKKSKLYLLSLIACIIDVIAIIGCGSKNDPQPSGTPPARLLSATVVVLSATDPSDQIKAEYAKYPTLHNATGDPLYKVSDLSEGTPIPPYILSNWLGTPPLSHSNARSFCKALSAELPSKIQLEVLVRAGLEAQATGEKVPDFHYFWSDTLDPDKHSDAYYFTSYGGWKLDVSPALSTSSVRCVVPAI